MALPLETYKNFPDNKNSRSKEMITTMATMAGQNSVNCNESDAGLNDKLKIMLKSI